MLKSTSTPWSIAWRSWAGSFRTSSSSGLSMNLRRTFPLNSTFFTKGKTPKRWSYNCSHSSLLLTAVNKRISDSNAFQGRKVAEDSKNLLGTFDRPRSCHGVLRRWFESPYSIIDNMMENNWAAFSYTFQEAKWTTLTTFRKTKLIRLMFRINSECFTRIWYFWMGRKSFARNAAATNFCSIFRYVHSDPHPGNILVHKNKNGGTDIVLLDHGLYAVSTLS